MRIQLTPSCSVEDFGTPFVIAELGSNHNGDMDLARRLILAARDAGADCVKFQSWSKESIFSRKVYEDNYFLADDYRNRKDCTLEDTVRRYAITASQLKDAFDFSKSAGIACTSTPFSKQEADFLATSLDAPFIKIASMDVNNYPFLDYVAGLGKPIVLSTGLSSLSEIDEAIRTLEKAGNTKIVVLHCVSIYPPADEQVHLNNIDTLRQAFGYPVGYSDHSLGTAIPLAAIAKGACVIEKHFTLDKALPGWDHKVSATPEELRAICADGRRINAALGSHRVACVESHERQIAFRRSVVAARPIKQGERIAIGDIDYKRPGSGFPPAVGPSLVGRTARRDIPFDKVIESEDLL